MMTPPKKKPAVKKATETDEQFMARMRRQMAPVIRAAETRDKKFRDEADSLVSAFDEAKRRMKPAAKKKYASGTRSLSDKPGKDKPGKDKPAKEKPAKKMDFSGMSDEQIRSETRAHQRQLGFRRTEERSLDAGVRGTGAAMGARTAFDDVVSRADAGGSPSRYQEMVDRRDSLSGLQAEQRRRLGIDQKGRPVKPASGNRKPVFAKGTAALEAQARKMSKAKSAGVQKPVFKKPPGMKKMNLGGK